MTTTAPLPHYDLVIVGAGPVGLEAAIRAKRSGLRYLVIEGGAVVEAIVRYPTYMTFFTTSERLEIGGHPLVASTDKPTRKEALDYYRRVVQNEGLAVRTFTEVTAVEPLADGTFRVGIQSDRDDLNDVHAHAVAIATGYYANPKRLGIPGEDLPSVSHYYSEAHPFYGRTVTIVGAGSSAADTALDLYRAGARVTIVHRGADFRHSLKYWIRPNIENRVKEGSIVAHFHTTVCEITPDAVIADKRAPGQPAQRIAIPTDQTFLLTGYFAAPELLRAAGVRIDPETLSAELDPETFETNVAGLYCIGSAGFGTRTSDVFIENGLVHAERAVDHLIARLTAARESGVGAD
ncbi:MAG: YpdA family putative bacillithiol disulfide reductase [Trueperaceae bacterium]|nr:YpdA family putative bacillithiol disulfide reductase [Trueperaceae bacterium]